MEARIKQLEAEKKDLERQVQELKAKAEAIEKREGERRALEEKKHAEEVTFLKRTNTQLKKELETYLAPTKK
jgi:dynein light intermediate chain, axonemal